MLLPEYGLDDNILLEILLSAQMEGRALVELVTEYQM